MARVGPGAWFFLALTAALLAGAREKLFRDPGTFWHVRVGEIILNTRTLPTADPFSIPFAGTPWVAYEWLAEIGMAVLHHAAGFDALLLASAVLIAGAFTIPFGRLVRAGFHWSVAAVLVGLAVAASASHYHARPHLVTLLFLTVTFAELLDYDADRSSDGRLLWLGPVFWVWANVHGGWLGGFGTVGLAVAGWLAFRAVGWPSPAAKGWWLVGWAGLLGLTAVTGPYGVGIPRTWLAIMRMSELPRLIEEHAPVDPTDPGTWPFFVLGLIYATTLAGLREKPRVTWLLPVVWFALGCDRVRNVSLFAVVMATAFADVFPRTVWAKRLAARPDLYRPNDSITGVGRAGVWLCVAVVLSVFGLQIGGVKWAAWPRSEWPVSLVPALHREAEHWGRPAAFNEYRFGGFLIYFAPEYRTFVDDRCEVFGGPWVARFVAAESDPAPAMAEWEAEYGRFVVALTRPGSGFDGYFAASPEWELVAEDQAGRLYRRHP